MFKFYGNPIFIALLLIVFNIAVLIFIKQNEKKHRIDYYKHGYEDAVKDFYKGKTKVDLIENEDGTKEWKWIENIELNY